MLLLLQSRGHLTADALAAELGVSTRTVFRDLVALSEAGIPVYAETGRYGGIRLVDGYRTQLTGLSESEAQTLFLAGVPDAAAQLGLGTVAAAAQTKVMAALPTELRTRARRITERFHLDAPRWFSRAEEVPCLAEVAGAVWDAKRLRISYRGKQQTTQRTIDPLGLVLKAGHWYLVAQHRGEPRTYRLSRIAEAERLDEPVQRPPDFDLAEAWTRQSAAFIDALQNYPVTALMSPEALRVFRRLLVPGSAAEVGVEPVSVEDWPDVPETWSLVRLRTESLVVAHSELLRLGGEAEVLEPAELRNLLTVSAQGMAARYLR